MPSPGVPDIPTAVSILNQVGGGTVNVAAGTYLLTQSIVLGSNVTVNGAVNADGSPAVTLQLPSSPNGIAMFTSNGGANMTIANFIMDGGIPLGAFLSTGTTANPYESSGVNMYSTNDAESNVTLRNLEIRNFAIGIFMGTENGVTIDHVYVHDNNPGNFAHNAYLVAVNNLNITHSRFNSAHTGDGLHIDFGGINTTITKSEFSSNNGLGVLSQGNFNVTFQDSITDFNTNDGIQTDASGLFILRDRGNYNGGYGFDVPDTLDGKGTINGYYGYGDNPDIGYLYEASYSNGTSNQSYPASVDYYSAVEADGVLGVNDTADWTVAYPGYQGVGAVDFNANHLANGSITFPHVGSATTALHGLIIGYSNGASGPLVMNLTVNGVAQPQISFPSTGSYSTWSTTSVNVPFVTGGNVVQLSVPSGAAAAPELNYLVVTSNGGIEKPPAPAQPTNLAASAVTPYQVNLTWSPSPTASGYNIYQNQRIIANNISANCIPNTGVSSCTYTDKHILLGNSTLTYSVQAVNQGGGGASSVVTVTTPIDSPAGFQASWNNGVALNWMSANGAASYKLKRASVSGGPYSTIASVPNTTNLVSLNFEQTYTDKSVVANTTYYYVVSAVDGSGNESATNSYQVSVLVPAPTFTLNPSSATLNPVPASSVSTAITVTPVNLFTGTVNLTLTSGLPVGATYTLTPVANNTATLTVTLPAGTALGTYNLVVTGTSGSITASTTVALTVSSQIITFNAIPPQVVGTSLTVNATATSGLPVSFSVVPNGNCSVSANVVTFLNTGNCGVLANQPGNLSSGGIYGPAPQVGQIVVVNSTPSGQTITFAPVGNQTVGAVVALNATATSALPVTFSASPGNVCSVSGSSAKFSGAGTCTLTASQAGNASYNAASPVSQTVTISGSAQTITFGNPGTQVVGTTLTLVASTTSGLALSYATTGPCAVTNGVASFSAAGTCAITVSQAGNGTYAAAAPVTQSFVVVATQMITFANPGTQTVGINLTLVASTTSSLPLSYTTTGPCAVTNGVASFSAAGTCAITVSQAGNGSYAAAAPVTRSFAVVATQTITFANPGTQTVGINLTLVASTTSGLPLAYTTTGHCAVTNGVASFSAAGTCAITVSQAGNGSYAAAAPVTQSFAVVATQTITFANPGTQTVGINLTLMASTTSGLALSYATTGPCAVTNGVASFSAAGTCAITVSQAGNGSYAAAAVTRSFAMLATQTITFNAIPAQIAGGTLTVSATASSGLPVTFTVVANGNCSVSGNVVTLLNVGNCGVIASQAGNSTYAAAAQVGQIIVINNPQAQTISFAVPASQATGTSEALSASATSGLSVSFASTTTSVCTVSGSTASLLVAGTCTIVASQPGNNVYGAATPVTRSFTVTSGTATTATAARATLAVGNYNTFAVTLAGFSAAPTTLGLGGVACVNISGCTVNLGGTSGLLNFEFGPVTSTGASLGVYVSNSIQFGTYAIPITLGTSTIGTFNLTVTAAAGFTISTSTSLTLARGTGGTVPVTITQTGGFSGSVALSLAGLPSGASDTFLTNSATSSTLVIYVPTSVTAGTYTLTINGTSGRISASTTLKFVVQ